MRDRLLRHNTRARQQLPNMAFPRIHFLKFSRFTGKFKGRLFGTAVPALLQFRGGGFFEAFPNIQVLLVFLEEVDVCGEEEGAEGGDGEFEEEDCGDGDEEDQPEEEVVAGVVEEIVWDGVDAFTRCERMMSQRNQPPTEMIITMRER
jgi:hypothetical protein